MPTLNQIDQQVVKALQAKRRFHETQIKAIDVAMGSFDIPIVKKRRTRRKTTRTAKK